MTDNYGITVFPPGTHRRSKEWPAIYTMTFAQVCANIIFWDNVQDMTGHLYTAVRLDTTSTVEERTQIRNEHFSYGEAILSCELHKMNLVRSSFIFYFLNNNRLSQFPFEVLKRHALFWKEFMHHFVFDHPPVVVFINMLPDFIATLLREWVELNTLEQHLLFIQQTFEAIMEYYENRLALAMSMHNRLGSLSMLHSLEDGNIRMIADAFHLDDVDLRGN